MSVYEKINKQFACYENYHDHIADSLSWLKARKLHTEESYQFYLSDFEQGSYRESAKKLYDELYSQRLSSNEKYDKEQKNIKIAIYFFTVLIVLSSGTMILGIIIGIIFDHDLGTYLLFTGCGLGVISLPILFKVLF